MGAPSKRGCQNSICYENRFKVDEEATRDFQVQLNKLRDEEIKEARAAERRIKGNSSHSKGSLKNKKRGALLGDSPYKHSEGLENDRIALMEDASYESNKTPAKGGRREGPTKIIRTPSTCSDDDCEGDGNATTQTLAKKPVAKAKHEYVRKQPRAKSASRTTHEGRNRHGRWCVKRGLPTPKRKGSKKGSKKGIETESQKPGVPRGRQ